ncbi:MAG: response regulator transcription factor [Terriglobia bacterium]|jgi:DNA-binding NarL/FixJ family response regulator
MRVRNGGKKKIRVLIADREGIFRFGLKQLFAVEDDLRVVAQADSALQLIELTKSLQPHLYFIQAEIITEAGGNLLADIRREAPKCKIVVTSSSTPVEDEGMRFIQLGASGIILKSVEPSLFVKCARKVVWENEVWLPHQQVARIAKFVETNASRSLRPVDTLTQREKTIISYLMQGWRNREIAQHLSITEQTVKNHLRSIYDKVGVSDRLELVLYAIHQKMALPPVQPPQVGARTESPR